VTDYQELNLDELGFLGRGKSKHRPRNDPALFGGDYPFIQTGDVKAANLHVREYSETYNETGLAQSKLWDKGTLLITIAANIAETAVLDIKACFPDSVVGFIPDESKVNAYFIKYYIDFIKREMQNISHGTTQDNLSLDKLRLFRFKVPAKDKVDEITDILLSYDKLIENNNRRIAILEEMAQSLYREWFVKFRFPGHENAKFIDSPLGKIPKGWEVKKLADVASINPESITKKNAPDNIRYIDIKSVGIGTIDEIKPMPFSEAPSRARRIVRDGDIIWATVRPNRKQYSYIAKPEENTVVSTGFAVIRAETVPKSYLTQVTSTDGFVSYLVNHATGAAYPAVNSKDFESADILVPDGKVLGVFDDVASVAVFQCETLKRTNRNLITQREQVLPKLISGDIVVSGKERE
jgi:type I restriction enzyme S subunit